ncbi:hypothetical protein D3C87_125270 [compost metagenome]
MRLYARHDTEEGAAPFEVTLDEARKLNQQGYGIHGLVNEFTGRRLKENVSKINYWYVEIDYDGKKLPVDELLKIFLIPSRIVETKNGYHLYFKAIDPGLELERYRTIQIRLREVYAGDENATDVTRTLRAPGFLHLKDPSDPFMVTEILTTDAEYKEAAMLLMLPKCQKEHKEEMREEKVKTRMVYEGDDFKSWIDSKDQKGLLEQLSGSYLVNGDQFRFYRASGGHWNTITNGKPSAWFVDNEGRIGSNRGGGPTVIQFIQFYGTYTSYKEVLDRLKEYFRR